ncbi:MAG: HAD family acid phosphatase [Elusimicrobia bacterium]|nr:HAD family acid phosphatase [Elusimicrobiota bacterium]
MIRLRTAPVLFALLLAAAPALAAPRLVLPPHEPTNIARFKQGLRDYHDCRSADACYATDLDREADEAIAALESEVKARRGEKLAVVLDIDDTALSNYAEVAREGFAYVPAKWAAWVDEAKAPAIPGTLRLFKRAKALGVAVFFITGRSGQEREATIKNLRAQGYDGWAGLILRGPGPRVPASVFKSQERRKLAEKGYRLALNVGDQLSDLRGEPQADVSVKLSNPFYEIP